MRRLLAALLLALALPAGAADDFSPAERALFMSNHLAQVRPPAVLRYAFAKSGSLEPGFSDRVVLQLKARPDGSCCLSEAEFLSGEHRFALPEVEAIAGNPVLLYFLERDVREMQRLTQGQPAYFRKRIRLAIYEGAQSRELVLPYSGPAGAAGGTVAARQFVVAPYIDDPLRERFQNLAPKRYLFTLSDAVPGGIYSIATRVGGADAPLVAEELLLEGAQPAPWP